MIKHLLFIFLIIITALQLAAQDNKAQKFIANIAEELLENEVSEATIEETTNTLSNWSETKPNINIIDPEELLNYQLINPMQAAELNDYKQKNGDLFSPFELIYLPSFDQAAAERLTWFFSFGKKAEKRRGLRQYTWGRHEVIAQYNRVIEKKEGYKDGDYEGEPGKKYLRYKYKYGRDLSLGITAEGDPGEAFFTGSNETGFDYYSMHFFMRPNENLRTIAIGDFQTTMGQGLICGQGIWGGKNSATTQIRNTRQGFKPYSSATEYGFMRGAAIEGAYKNFNAGVFASYQDIDASLDTTDNINITSLSSTGLHRTVGEISKKDITKEFISGGFLQGRFGNLKINVNSIFTRYEHPVKPGNQLYDLYDPEGTEFSNLSSSYLYQVNRFTFFGEIAWSSSQAWANIHGLTFYPTESAGLALLYRNYDKKFVSLHGYGLGEASGVQNEEGFYLGLEWLPFKYTKVNLYADFFKFPWLRYGEKAPSDGSEYLINIDYSPKRDIDFETRFKYEKKLTSVSEDQLADIAYGELYKWRIQSTMDYTEALSGQVRLAYSHFNQDTAKYNGWLIYYEHFYEPPQSSFRLSFRINMFDVEDYTARIYTYERDVLYSFSVPSFQATGIRYYLNLKWDVLEDLALYARIDRTNYLHKKEVSSGNELIEEPHKTAVHLKMRWTF